MNPFDLGAGLCVGFVLGGLFQAYVWRRHHSLVLERLASEHESAVHEAFCTGMASKWGKSWTVDGRPRA